MSLILTEPTTYEFVFLSVFFLALIVQLFFYFLIYLRVPIFKIKTSIQADVDLLPVSVIICARNEEMNLESFLPLVLEQKYPNYEVIVVDDCSTDDTDMLLKRFLKRYDHLRVTTIKQDDKFSHGKKLALTIGIKAAKHEWVLLTDADCKPESNEWIATMASNFDATNQVVLGYGGYISQKGFLNKFLRFDTFFIALQYFGFALMGKPYMGVGRNLAYRKELFFQNKGFASHSHLSSGDDDLFIHQVANKRNTAVEFRVNSHTRSVPQATLSEWIKQKRRHLTSSPLYKTSTKVWLGLEPLTRILFWASGIVLLAEQFNTIIIASIMSFRVLSMFIILKIAMNRLNERKIFILSLIYDLFAPLLISSLMLINRLTKKRSKWN
ncbi:MAG: transmembrane glycosyltransferase [Bacteroidetes bacterium HGW-Bacteroidetes-15]|nr:MAG: transmembrane glycosyltransferase [Bacteroidetes bacterium HGW-Bacteroidetes-15]